MRIVAGGAKKRQEVIAKMDKKGNYQVNSNNLKKQGLLETSTAAYGMAELTLPFIDEYIIKYCV